MGCEEVGRGTCPGEGRVEETLLGEQHYRGNKCECVDESGGR